MPAPVPRAFADWLDVDANPLVGAALLDLLAEPDRLPPPVVFHGAGAVGSQGLLRRLTRQLTADRPELSIAHYSADALTKAVQGAARRRASEALAETLARLDVLLVERLATLGGRTATQRLLCRTIDQAVAGGRQVVVALAQPPRELSQLPPTLRSRLQAGVVIRLDPPGADRRLERLDAALRRRGLELAETLRREAADRLDQPAQLELLAELLQELGGAGRRVPRAMVHAALDRLQARSPLVALVARLERQLKLPEGQLAGRGGPRGDARWRRLAMLLCHERGNPRAEIASHFDVKPASVNAAIRRARAELAEDTELQRLHLMLRPRPR